MEDFEDPEDPKDLETLNGCELIDGQMDNTAIDNLLENNDDDYDY